LELPRIYFLNAQTSPRPHLSPLGPQARIAASLALGLHLWSQTQMRDDTTTALLRCHSRGTIAMPSQAAAVTNASHLATFVSLSREHVPAPFLKMPIIAGGNDIAWSAINITTDSIHCSYEPQHACSYTTFQSSTYKVYAWHKVYRYVSRIFFNIMLCLFIRILTRK
jgi:hypothetical protein